MKRYIYQKSITDEKKNIISHTLFPMSFADMSGPMVEHEPETGFTRMAVLSESGRTKFEVRILDRTGKRFEVDFRQAGSSDGPTLCFENGRMTFGQYLDGSGYYDSLYRVEAGKPIEICWSNAEEKLYCSSDVIVEEKLDINMNFQFCPDIEAVSYRHRKVIGGWIEEYVVGSPKGKAPTMAAVIEESGRSYVGQWSGNAFNGVVLSADDKTYWLRRYVDGNIDESWELVCIPDRSGTSWCVRKEDGTYICLIYDLNPAADEMCLRIRQLDASFEEIQGSVMVVPNYGQAVQKQYERRKNNGKKA